MMKTLFIKSDQAEQVTLEYNMDYFATAQHGLVFLIRRSHH